MKWAKTKKLQKYYDSFIISWEQTILKLFITHITIMLIYDNTVDFYTI